MNESVRAAVIGGGIVGCSVLYHLARLGWNDTLLIERKQLTSGSTWHAAGNVTFFGHYPSITKLYVDSLRTYLEAEAISGHSIGFHDAGSLRLATREEEVKAFQELESLYSSLEVDYEIVGVNDIKRIHPLIETDDLVGAAYTPGDGHLDAAAATYALAKAARKLGASLECNCRVEALEPRSDGKWNLKTSSSHLIAEHVVVATSFWAREMLSSVGLQLPVFALEHQEIITDSISEIERLEFELPTVRDPVAPANIRQDGTGLLCGIYESNPKAWMVDGIPDDFGETLLPADLERLEPHLQHVVDRIPVFGKSGIKVVNNGPICYTPDGCPLVGPVAGFSGLWIATGFCVGIGTGGGAGRYLSNWIINGIPPYDLAAVNPSRFQTNLKRLSVVKSIKKTYAMGYEFAE